MTEMTLGTKLAMILQAIEDTEREKKDYDKSWKSRMQNLETQAWATRTEILSGQMPLIPEPPLNGHATGKDAAAGAQ